MNKVGLLLTITCLAMASWLSAEAVATSDEVEIWTTRIDFELAQEDVEEARAFIGMLRRDAGPGGVRKS